MDEMYTQKDFGVAISALYILSFIGFPIAVIFGAATLNTYVTLNPPEGMDPRRPEWVGAWWLGFLVPGVVILGVSFIVMLFPVQMPAAKVRRHINFHIIKKIIFTVQLFPVIHYIGWIQFLFISDSFRRKNSERNYDCEREKDRVNQISQRDN